MESDPVPNSEIDKLRIVANQPEVHAAAILAAKDYLLAQGGMRGIKSDKVAAAIGFHAALILRWYLAYLDPSVSDEVFDANYPPDAGK